MPVSASWLSSFARSMTRWSVGSCCDPCRRNSRKTRSRVPNNITRYAPVCGSWKQQRNCWTKCCKSSDGKIDKRQYRTKSVWRLCTPSACKFSFRACFVSSRTHLACIFSEIFRENTRKSTKDFLRFSLHLSKNLTTQSAYVRYETDSHISQKCS